MMMMMMMMMHDAPDEVRLCRVQRVHQGGELHQVDRGHRLPSAALLLLSLCLLFLKKNIFIWFQENFNVCIPPVQWWVGLDGRAKDEQEAGWSLST